jgi:hypothetical protein
MLEVEWHHVGHLSSNVYAFAYDASTARLIVQFKRQGGPGPIYEYLDVPASVYAAMMYAGSYGRFVWRNIKGRYAYRRIG